MTEEPILFLYITKHSLEGVAASNQIKYQVQGFKESKGKNFRFIYMDKSSSKRFYDEKLAYPIYTKSVLTFFLKLLNILSSLRNIRFVYTRDMIVVLGCILKRKKVIYECHHEGSFLSKIFLKYAHKLFEIVAISEGLKKFLVKELAIPAAKISVLHDAVDYKKYDDSRPQRQVFREDLNLANNRVFATYTGTVGQGRDILNFYNAIKFNPDINFIIIGDDGSKFKSLLNITNLPKNLEFKGYLNKNEVVKYQIASDILINLLDELHPNYKYCSQLKLFEYLATGNIVISPNIGSLEEIATSDKCLIYSQSSNSQLKKILYKVHADLKSEDIRLLTENARNFVKDRTWIKRAEKIINIFN